MKKRFLFIVVVLLFTILPVKAQLLWKISGNNLEKPSYLFGTHHVAPLSICDSIAGFKEAFNSCSQLCGEVEMGDMNAMAKEMVKYLILPKDSLLDRIYTQDEYKMLGNFFKQEMNTEIDKVKMLKPAALSAQLAMVVCMKTFKDFNPNKQLDATMQNRAKEKGMQVRGLESLQFQTDLLMGAPITEQAADLMKVIKNYDRLTQYDKELCNAYLKQDLNQMMEYIEDLAIGYTEEQVSRIIYDRNKNWVEQLKDILSQQPTFIVVGAGHLPGSQGLIELLRKQGYSVEPVW